MLNLNLNVKFNDLTIVACPVSWPEQSMPHSLGPIKYWTVIAVSSKDNTWWLPHFILDGRRLSCDSQNE